MFYIVYTFLYTQSHMHAPNHSLTHPRTHICKLSFEQSGQSFLGNETSGELTNLLPGENYQIRLRAYNLAGASEPSNIVEHMPPAKRKRNATSLLQSVFSAKNHVHV